MIFPRRGGAHGVTRPTFSALRRGKLFKSFVLMMFIMSGFSALAQDTVTIPKSRLEELQRKEAELDRLKGDLKETKGENAKLKKQHEEDAVKISTAPATQPVVTHVSRPMASLPPFKAGDTIDAMDLANYYRADAAAADQRFRKQVLRVEGEISAFERLPFISDFWILLKTPDRDIRLVCEMNPLEKYGSVFTVKHGSELVGQLSGRNRVAIAKVGDKVVIEGKCRGLSDATVKLSGCELKSLP